MLAKRVATERSEAITFYRPLTIFDITCADFDTRATNNTLFSYKIGEIQLTVTKYYAVNHISKWRYNEPNLGGLACASCVKAAWLAPAATRRSSESCHLTRKQLILTVVVTVVFYDRGLFDCISR